MLYNWHDLIGNLGVVLILSTYLLLQLDKLPVTRASYSITNGLGAFFILVSLVNEFNLSAFVVELAWLLISVYGLIRCLRRGRSEAGVD